MQLPLHASTTVKTSSIDYYKVPLEDDRIVFVDSEATYQRLLDRLFGHPNEELFIGFDCKFIQSSFNAEFFNSMSD